MCSVFAKFELRTYQNHSLPACMKKTAHKHKPNQTSPYVSYRFQRLCFCFCFFCISYARGRLCVSVVLISYVHTHTWRLFLWFIQVNLKQAEQANKLLNWFRWHEYNTLQTHGNRNSCVVPPHSQKTIQTQCTWSIHAIQNGSNLAVKLDSRKKIEYWHISTFGSGVGVYDHFKCRATAYDSDYKSVRFHFVRKQGNERMNARKTPCTVHTNLA